MPKTFVYQSLPRKGARAVPLAALLLCFFAVKSPHALAAPSTPPSPALDPAAKQEAAKRFDQGVRYFQSENFAAALIEFQTAYDLTRKYELLFNIGVTQRRLFRYSEAISALDQYLKLGEGKLPRERTQAVETELAAIRAVTGKLTISVAGEPAEVFVDNVSKGQTPFAEPLILSVGPHAIRVLREGFQPYEKQIITAGKSNETLAVSLSKRVIVELPAELSILARPAGAELWVDTQKVGVTRWKGPVPPGGHQISARLSGYNMAAQEVVLSAGQEREVEFMLTRTAQSGGRSWYKSWYVWAGVGAVVVGGVAVAVLASDSGGSNVDATIRFPP